MPIQAGTFKRLPPKEDIIAAIEREREYLSDFTPFVLYIKPIAEKLGVRTYDIAARLLLESGYNVDASQLRQMAEELGTDEGKERHAEKLTLHLEHVGGYLPQGTSRLQTLTLVCDEDYR